MKDLKTTEGIEDQEEGATKAQEAGQKGKGSKIESTEKSKRAAETARRRVIEERNKEQLKRDRDRGTDVWPK